MRMVTRAIQRMVIEYHPRERGEVNRFLDKISLPYHLVRSGPKMIDFGKADPDCQHLVIDIVIAGEKPYDPKSCPWHSS